ncbi:MAG: winged helix-turn-helix transcriptional regulator [Candidatus Diapherotrites archaeon]|nr:winged helix-turn-helix transcriptional regulator [Candidatus Diapherotrites archaeon]
MLYDSRLFRRNVWYLLGATRGGPMRAKIMHSLMGRPLNPNQLSERLGVDYKTARHHLDVLKKHNWVTSSMDKYGELFFPAFTDEQCEVFAEIWTQLGKNFKNQEQR